MTRWNKKERIISDGEPHPPRFPVAQHVIWSLHRLSYTDSESLELRNKAIHTPQNHKELVWKGKKAPSFLQLVTRQKLEQQKGRNDNPGKNPVYKVDKRLLGPWRSESINNLRIKLANNTVVNIQSSLGVSHDMLFTVFLSPLKQTACGSAVGWGIARFDSRWCHWNSSLT